ncbi:hypothetical protein BASU183_14390 [Bacillus subtilis]
MELPATGSFFVCFGQLYWKQFARIVFLYRLLFVVKLGYIMMNFVDDQEENNGISRRPASFAGESS